MNTNIPTTDFSPVFSAFNVYQRAKQNAMQDDPLGVIAKTAVGIGGVLWDWKQKDDVIHAQDHARGVQEEFDRLQRLAALGPSNKDEDGTQGISAEEFQQSVGTLKQKLGSYQYQTPAGKAVIDDYTANGFSQDLNAMTQRVGKIFIERDTAILNSKLKNGADKDTGDSQSYASQLSALDSSMAAAKEAESKAQGDLASATAEDANADKSLAEIQGYQAQAGQGNEGLNQDVAASLASASSTKSEKAKARAEAEARAGTAAETARKATETYETARATGTDGYKNWARAEIKASGLFRDEQVESVVNEWVLYRDNGIANKNVASAQGALRFDKADQYIDSHKGFYADEKAVKAAKDQNEEARQQFGKKNWDAYISYAQQPDNWNSPAKLQSIIDEVGRKGNPYNEQIADGPMGSNDCIDELTKRKEFVLNLIKGGDESQKLHWKNEAWQLYDNYKRGNTRGIQNQRLTLDSLDQIAVAAGDNIDYKSDIMGVRDAIIDMSQGSAEWKDFTKMTYAYRDSLIKNKTGKDLESANNIGILVIDGMEKYRGQYPDAKRPEIQAEYNRLTSKAIGQAMDSLSKMPSRSIPDSDAMKWAGKYRMSVVKGNADDMVNFTTEQGRLVVNPGIKGAFEESVRVTNSEFNRQHAGEGLQVGKNVIPYTDDAGRLTYFAKKPDGSIDVYHEAPNKDGINFVKEGSGGKLESSLSNNNPQVKAFRETALQVAQMVDGGIESFSKADAMAEKLKAAYAKYPTKTDEAKQLYDDLMKRLSSAILDKGFEGKQ